MMQQPIAHGRLVDASRLRVAYVKGLIGRVFVGLLAQIFVERYDVPHEISLELLNILSLSFAVFELVPCFE